jgi:16S rRNA pseudouridine516 synthase
VSIERLDKILSHEGYGTRKSVKHFVRTHEVLVNGKATVDPSSHFDTENDVLSVDGEVLSFKKNVYLMMNKKADYVCANKDGLHETVFSGLEDKYRTGFMAEHLHLIGRLDIDTEGLLIFTTDGELTHRLTSPKTHCPKTYFVRLSHSVNDAEYADYSDKFAKGIHIEREDNEDEADLESAKLARGPNENEMLLTIYEGKYHQVKRMFKAVGNEVIYLKRLSIGSLSLDESLNLGSYREMTDDEVLKLEH